MWELRGVWAKAVWVVIRPEASGELEVYAYLPQAACPHKVQRPVWLQVNGNGTQVPYRLMLFLKKLFNLLSSVTSWYLLLVQNGRYNTCIHFLLPPDPLIRHSAMACRKYLASGMDHLLILPSLLWQITFSNSHYFLGLFPSLKQSINL